VSTVDTLVGATGVFLVTASSTQTRSFCGFLGMAA